MTQPKWEIRPVPGMRTIVIAEEGMMYPFAHVTTPTPTPEPLTDLEYEHARRIVASVNLLQPLSLGVLELADIDLINKHQFRQKHRWDLVSEALTTSRDILLEAFGPLTPATHVNIREVIQVLETALTRITQQQE